MDMEKIEKLLSVKENFDEIFDKMEKFVTVVNNIEYSEFETKLNEVTKAELWSMDIRGVSDLEIKKTSFECVVKVEGNIELEERAFGERIKDAVVVNFEVTVSGIIKNEEMIIKDIEGIEVF